MIFNSRKSIRLEVAAVNLAGRTREVTPPDSFCSVKVVRLHLIRSSTTVEHALRCDCGRSSRGQVQYPAGLPILDHTCPPSGTFAGEKLTRSNRQIECAVRIDHVRAVGPQKCVVRRLVSRIREA